MGGGGGSVGPVDFQEAGLQFLEGEESMDFGFTEEQEKLRKEVHDWLKEHLPEDYQPVSITKEQNDFMVELQKEAQKKGWITAGWPKKYGGMGFSEIETGIVMEETRFVKVRWPGYQGFNQVAPAVLLFGTDEQKEMFVPPITRGEQLWFQAFTEPEAGSDEANVQCRAVEDGDDFVINGQKTFISGMHKPDYLYTLVKTADVKPKHRGISIILVPADAPGITYQPQNTMGDEAQNNIFFDNVRVSRKMLIGQLNRGFYHAMATMEFERAGTHWGASTLVELKEFIHFCKEEKRNGQPLIKDPNVRRALARRALEVEVTRLSGWFAAGWDKEKAGPPPPAPSSRFFFKMFIDGWCKVAMDILGLHGQLKEGSRGAVLAGKIGQQWEMSRSTHAGGTVEVYKNVLAERGLGLPRIPGEMREMSGEAIRKAAARG